MPSTESTDWRCSMEATSTKYKKLHEESKVGWGRPIPAILFSREVHGRRFVGGVRRYNYNCNAAEGGDGEKEQEMKEEEESEELRAKKRDMLNSHPLPLTSEIQNYGEYHSVTHFHSSYLNHLSGSSPQQLQQQQQHPPPNTSSSTSAVSTISIAFSPNGKTLASTHGDHTVKITCTSTGKLIRNLEGHPRTPWTVKYHPTKSNIVASGCLGFQVRVWDWNWRSERVKMEEREKRRRKRIARRGVGAVGDGNRRRRRRRMKGRSGSPRGVGQYDSDDSSSYDSSSDDDAHSSEDEFDESSSNYAIGMGVCLNMIRLQHAIISLAFHPSGKILAVASGSTLHLWDYDDYAGQMKRKKEMRMERKKKHGKKKEEEKEGVAASGGRSSLSTNTGSRFNDWQNRNSSTSQPRLTYTSSQSSTRPTLSTHRIPSSSSSNTATGSGNRGGARTEMRHENALRCVHFPPSGTTIIVGGANPNPTSGSGMSGGGMSFSLRLWDFDLEAALNPGGTGGGGGGGVLYSRNQQGVGRGGVRREAMSNARTFVPRALLYNDGGFDVSPDGKTLCACAEYWLPEGVNNAMDILDKPPPAPHHQDGDNHNDPNTSMEEMNENGTAENSTAVTSSSSGYSSPPRQRSITSGSGNTLPSTRIAPHIPLIQGGILAPRPQPPPPSSSQQQQYPLPPSSYPVTPPNTNRARMPLSPPSPPGRRWPGGLHQQPGGQGGGTGAVSSSLTSRERGTISQRRHQASAPLRHYSGTTSRYHHHSTTGGVGTNIISASPPPPPPPPPHQPHPLAIIDDGTLYSTTTTNNNTTTSRITPPRGRYVPHIVTVSLEDITPVPINTTQNPIMRHGTSLDSSTPQPHLGQILEASPLDGSKASGVTCVKFSPSAQFCLLGYGVREATPSSSNSEEEEKLHPVTALYRIKGGLAHVSTMMSGDDDVNIARFHPESGYGFVYGTKQGRVRVLSPRPWNYYHP